MINSPAHPLPYPPYGPSIIYQHGGSEGRDTKCPSTVYMDPCSIDPCTRPSYYPKLHAHSRRFTGHEIRPQGDSDSTPQGIISLASTLPFVFLSTAWLLVADLGVANGASPEAHGRAQSYTPDNIYEAAEASVFLNNFLAAADAAGLGDALRNPDFNGTIFAPVDLAFNATLDNLSLTLEELAAANDTLTDLLSFHIVPDGYYFPLAALSDDRQIKTMLGPELFVDRSVPGLIHIYGGPPLDNPLNFATILQYQRIKGNNAILYIIDRVLMPPDAM
eukprot:gene31357-6513_t